MIYRNTISNLALVFFILQVMFAENHYLSVAILLNTAYFNRMHERSQISITTFALCIAFWHFIYIGTVIPYVLMAPLIFLSIRLLKEKIIFWGTLKNFIHYVIINLLFVISYKISIYPFGYETSWRHLFYQLVFNITLTTPWIAYYLHQRRQ